RDCHAVGRGNGIRSRHSVLDAGQLIGGQVAVGVVDVEIDVARQEGGCPGCPRSAGGGCRQTSGFSRRCPLDDLGFNGGVVERKQDFVVAGTETFSLPVERVLLGRGVIGQAAAAGGGERRTQRVSARIDQLNLERSYGTQGGGHGCECNGVAIHVFQEE